MSARTIELTSAGRTLAIDGKREWSTMLLVIDEVERKLGAHTFDYMRDHLCKFLEQPTDEMAWVLSLMEMHTSMYGYATASGVILRLQDKDAKFFADLHISQDERKHWLSILQDRE